MKTISPEELDAVVISIRAINTASERILDEVYKVNPSIEFIKERTEAIKQLNSNCAEALNIANLI